MYFTVTPSRLVVSSRICLHTLKHNLSSPLHAALRVNSFTIRSYVKLPHLYATDYLNRNAIIDSSGIHKFKSILYSSNKIADLLANVLNKNCDESDSDLPRVAIFCPNNSSYVSTLFAAWMIRTIAVPLNKDYPPSELEYFLCNSEPSVVVTTEGLREKIEDVAAKLNIPLLTLSDDYYRQHSHDQGIICYFCLFDQYNYIFGYNNNKYA